MSAARVAAARILSASVAYAAPALLLSWYLGGQALTGGIDAWLAVPLLMPGALRHARLSGGLKDQLVGVETQRGQTRGMPRIASLSVRWTTSIRQIANPFTPELSSRAHP